MFRAAAWKLKGFYDVSAFSSSLFLSLAMCLSVPDKRGGSAD